MHNPNFEGKMCVVCKKKMQEKRLPKRMKRGWEAHKCSEITATQFQTASSKKSSCVVVCLSLFVCFYTVREDSIVAKIGGGKEEQRGKEIGLIKEKETWKSLGSELKSILVWQRIRCTKFTQQYEPHWLHCWCLNVHFSVASAFYFAILRECLHMQWTVQFLLHSAQSRCHIVIFSYYYAVALASQFMPGDAPSP